MREVFGTHLVLKGTEGRGSASPGIDIDPQRDECANVADNRVRCFVVELSRDLMVQCDQKRYLRDSESRIAVDGVTRL